MRTAPLAGIAWIAVGACSLAGLDDYASGHGGAHTGGAHTGDAGPDAPACTMCGGGCVDTLVDPENCGGCGVTCAKGYACLGGVCGNAVVDVAPGHSSCAALRSGEVWCWGRNVFGEVGIPPAQTDQSCVYSGGSGRCQTTAVKVAGLSGVVEVSGGRSVACARTGAGEVYCWGSNLSGALGHDPAGDPTCAKAGEPDLGDPQPCSVVPVRVALPEGVRAAQLAVGAVTACVVTTEKDLYCWGANPAGEVAIPIGGSHWQPRKNPNVNGDAEEVRLNLRNEGDATVCVRQSQTGSVRCWGASHGGALFSPSGSWTCPTGPGCDPDAQVVSGAPADTFGIGAYVGCAVKAGDLRCWGENRYGQMGNGGPNTVHEPEVVAGLPPVAAVSMRLVSTVILAADGGVWALGWADEGLIGNGAFGSDDCPLGNGQRCENTVKQVPGLSGIAKVVSGNYTMAAIGKTGQLWMWGGNYIAGLGHTPGAGDVPCAGTGPNACSPTPQLVSGLP